MKPRTKKICEKCKKEISVSNFAKHQNLCKGMIKKKQIKINNNWLQKNEKYKCPYCNKECRKFGICTHIWKQHTEEGRLHDSNKGYTKGRIIWNKGLTKQNNESLKRQGQTFSKRCQEGLIKTWKGKHHTLETKEKLSINCNKNLIFSSLNEREIRKYFKEKYTQFDWKSGNLIKYKNEILNVDMYSHVLKICFEYDGIWHFKDIHNQLKHKQYKDNLLEEWCIKNNYRLIRIDENDYINFEQIEKLIFEESKKIIKIGKRYIV